MTSVPTTIGRIKRRGYNQAELVARELARELQLPYAEVLARQSNNSSQIALKPLERRANVMNAFVLTSIGNAVVRGRRVVLVDDVLTTGATGSSAAKALSDGAPKNVGLCVFARTIPTQD